MKTNHRPGLAGARAAFAFVCAAFASHGSATPAHALADAATRPAPRALDEVTAVAHAQRAPIPASLRAPQPTSREHYRESYDDAHTPLQRTSVVCDNALFAGASGATLVANVRGADTSCINALFNVTGTPAAQIFAEAKMVSIANAMQADAAAYPGNNNAHMLQLVLFLRAGYYVQYYDSADVGSYGPALAGAIRPALDAFVANAHFTDANDGHGAVLSEFVTLIDSSGENAHHLGTVAGILARYPAGRTYSYMRSATNNVFTVMFRGHYDPAFVAAVQANNAILDALANFISTNKATEAGTSNEYLLSNAGRELARFLQYPDPLQGVVRPKVKGVLDQFALTGTGSGIYVATADLTDYYDHAHCAYYGLCSFAQDLEAAILPAANARDCSATLRVRSQALTPAQLDLVCSTVAGEETYFHTLMNTNHQPLANDHNDRLEMVIFHSSDDYGSYSGTIFGNDTNNGGIYLEGDPTNPANQPRFLAYEAEWLRPDFQVWNLTHEYIHYLDGRFDMAGSFGDYPLDAPYSAVWYIEGFAEYMSYSYRNVVYTKAVTEAATPGKFTMAQLFDSEYGTDYTRTYQWGYMATRFMFERHRPAVDSMLALFRSGNYTPGYHTWLDATRSTLNADFLAWVTCYSTHDGDTSNCAANPVDAIFKANFEDPNAPPPVTECTDANVGVLGNNCSRSNLASASAGAPVYLSLWVPAGISSLSFEMSGGTGEADIYVRGGNWPSDTTYDYAPKLTGNAETVVVSNPSGGQHFYLMVKGRPSFAGVRVVARYN